MAKSTGSRINTEKPLPHETFVLKFGTTNKNHPETVYVQGRTYISPNSEKDNYKDDIRLIKYGLNRSVRSATERNKYLKSGSFILDTDIATSGIKKGKTSFLRFEFFFSQPKGQELKFNEMKQCTEEDIYEIISSLEENIVKHDFSLSKIKK